MVNNRNIFAENLRRLMDEAGKTRKDICEALGISYFTVSSWVNGSKYPRMDKVEMLAKYFGVSKSDLIEDKDTEAKKKKVDVAVEIVVRLGSDQQFCDAVKMLYKLDSKQLSSVTQMLSSFFRDGS